MASIFQNSRSITVCVLCLFFIHRSNGIECGTVKVINDLVRGGNETVKGAWPFAVALYKVNRTQPSCGGTLISKKHILTAAHCIHNKMSRSRVKAHHLKAYLGAHNLLEKDEVGVVEANIEGIRVHPEWNPYFTSNFNADLAILVLNENISFTKYIRPVCFPADSAETNSGTIDLKGTVVGWGLTDANDSVSIQRQASIVAVNDTYCYHKDEALPTFSSNHTFCGGFGDGYPTLGDSGGGFFVLTDETWVQYGIISATLTNRTGHATGTSIQIYTNLMSFKRWIVSTVRETGGEIGEAMETIRLICDFTYQNESLYGCVIDKLNVQKDNIRIESVSGSHLNDKTNENVAYLVFGNGTLTYLPHGIGNFFPNLKIMQIGQHLGTKRITRSYFKSMYKLEQLPFFENNIDTLEEDSLWDLENLEVFQLVSNDIAELHEGTFAKNTKLQLITFNSNKLRTLPKHLFRENSLLKHVDFTKNFLHKIDETTFETNERLEYIDLSWNRLDVLPQHLFKNNFLLKFLFLSNNLIKTIDEKHFHTNINLISISLSSNHLESLGGNIFENNLLVEYLYLRNNSIRSLGGGIFEKNSHLKIIDLSSNQLKLSNSTTAINEAIFEANIHLTGIDLSYNRMEYLPNTLFRNNLMLNNIYLRGNSIEAIDERSFEANSNVIQIDLSFNQLDYLPKNVFQNNLELKFVALQDNLLESVDVNTFIQNTNLRSVDLASNRLESISSNLFKNNLLLDAISLGNNSLKAIDDDTFDTNPHLRIINLSANRLESVPRNWLKNNLALEYILLQDNRLRFIEIDFTKMKNVKRITIFNNVCTDDRIYQRHFDIRQDVLSNGKYLQLFQESINYFCRGTTHYV